ncbi:MAG: hypothetical protein AB9873_17885 [Syntrophobacteraceae bacterium]
MTIRHWGIPLFGLVIVLAVYTPAQSVTTTYGGETIEWELTANGVPVSVFNEVCEDVHPPIPTNLSFTGKCTYTAHWPPVGSELHVVASSIPASVNPPLTSIMDTFALDVCFPSYYADCIRSQDCIPLLSEDWALFHPPNDFQDRIDINYYRQWVYLPSGGDSRQISIDVYLMNPEMGSLQSMPHLKGPPKDNRQTRYRPPGGGGPGR